MSSDCDPNRQGYYCPGQQCTASNDCAALCCSRRNECVDPTSVSHCIEDESPLTWWAILVVISFVLIFVIFSIACVYLWKKHQRKADAKSRNESSVDQLLSMDSNNEGPRQSAKRNRQSIHESYE